MIKKILNYLRGLFYGAFTSDLKKEDNKEDEI